MIAQLVIMETMLQTLVMFVISLVLLVLINPPTIV